MYMLDRVWFGCNLVKKNHFGITSTLNGLRFCSHIFKSLMFKFMFFHKF